MWCVYLFSALRLMLHFLTSVTITIISTACTTKVHLHKESHQHMIEIEKTINSHATGERLVSYAVSPHPFSHRSAVNSFSFYF